MRCSYKYEHIHISYVGEGLKIWQQNSFCVRDEPFVISLMNCHNDKPFMRITLSSCPAVPHHNLTASLLRVFLRRGAELDNPCHCCSRLLRSTAGASIRAGNRKTLLCGLDILVPMSQYQRKNLNEIH